jgi:hypothetical protein
MSKLLAASGGSDDGSNEQADQRRSYRRQRRSDPLPDAEEIQRMILALTEAIILGRISARDATAIQRNLRMLLDAQLRQDRQPGTVSNYEAVVEMCRRDPSAVQTIEPFLSETQLDSLMKEIGGGSDGSP